MSDRTETEMKDSQARLAGKRAKLLTDKAVEAQEVGMHALAASYLKQAVYEAQGAQLMSQSLAEEKRVEAERAALKEAM